MDDEDPRIDDLERENAALRARVAELEAIQQRAREMAETHEDGFGGKVARWILGEA
jgi:hypothetical protein